MIKFLFLTIVAMFLLVVPSATGDWVRPPSTTTSGNVTGVAYMNQTNHGNITADYFIGDGSQLTGVSGSGSGSSSFVFEYYTGADCAGTNPGKTLNATTTPEMVIVERETLHLNHDYTTSGTVITFNISIIDDMLITVGTNSSQQYAGHTGADLVGNDLTVAFTPNLVVVERETLRLNTDYTLSGNTITFTISVTSDMRISVWG